MRHTALALLGCLLLAGCPETDPPKPDAGAEDAGVDAGPCAEPATLYGIDIDEKEQDLADGSTLPITLGFQGFQYVRVGIRTSLPLPATVNVWVHVKVEGSVDRTTPFFGVETRPAPGGETETVDVSVMFNDVPLADLVGHGASVRLYTTTPGCMLGADSDVLLTMGAYQGPDGGDLDGGDGGVFGAGGGDGG